MNNLKEKIERKKYYEAAEILYKKNKQEFRSYIDNKVINARNSNKYYCQINLLEIKNIIEKLTEVKDKTIIESYEYNIMNIIKNELLNQYDTLSISNTIFILFNNNIINRIMIRIDYFFNKLGDFFIEYNNR